MQCQAPTPGSLPGEWGGKQHGASGPRESTFQESYSPKPDQHLASTHLSGDLIPSSPKVGRYSSLCFTNMKPKAAKFSSDFQLVDRGTRTRTDY